MDYGLVVGGCFGVVEGLCGVVSHFVRSKDLWFWFVGRLRFLVVLVSRWGYFGFSTIFFVVGFLFRRGCWVCWVRQLCEDHITE